MQASEVIQVICGVLGLCGVAWSRVLFTRRAQRNSQITSFSPRELCINRVSWAIIGIALILVFFPF